MIAANFLWGNVFLGRKLQMDEKNSNCKILESALYIKSVSMPLSLPLCIQLNVQVFPNREKYSVQNHCNKAA